MLEFHLHKFNFNLQKTHYFLVTFKAGGRIILLFLEVKRRLEGDFLSSWKLQDSGVPWIWIDALSIDHAMKIKNKNV